MGARAGDDWRPVARPEGVGSPPVHLDGRGNDDSDGQAAAVWGAGMSASNSDDRGLPSLPSASLNGPCTPRAVGGPGLGWSGFMSVSGLFKFSSRASELPAGAVGGNQICRNSGA